MTAPLGIFIRPGSQSSIENCLERARHNEVNYPDVGATLSESTPKGYHVLHQQLCVRIGRKTFVRASEGLITWQAHMGRGMSIYPLNVPLQEGETILILLGTAAVVLVAPCRIIRIVDLPQRFAFAYGTLPHHPEIGEEMFEVRIGNDGQVNFSIHAFSRAGHPSVKSLGPLARKVQARASKKYLTTLHSFVEAG